MHRIHPFAQSNQWLILIGAGKLLKGVLFIALGFGALHLMHRDLVSLVGRWVTDLRFDPEGRFVNFLLDKVSALTPHRMRQISMGIFLYAALDLLEGIGLVLGKGWAEYMTLVFSVALLPWEFLAIVHKPTWPKTVLTLVNLAVALYLAAYLRRRAQRHALRA